MTDPTQSAALAAKTAKDSELVALKRQMDKLKNDLNPGPSRQQKLRTACQNFEAVFISKLWEQMRSTVPKSGMFNSQQEEMYRSMFDREFTEKMARDGGIGLGDMLYAQLKEKLQGGGKGAGVSGGRMLNGSLAKAPVEERGTDGKIPEPKTFDLSASRTGRGAKEPDAGRGADSAAQALASASQTLSEAGKALGAAGAGQPPQPSRQQSDTQSQAPQPPASVPAADMAQVEALARRIEADYDRRQVEGASAQLRAGRYAASNGRSDRNGSGFAVIG